MRTIKRTKNLTHGALPRRMDELAAAGRLPALLERLPDERHRALLFLRHAVGLSWPAIQEAGQQQRLYYCERQLYRLYAQALSAAARLLEDGDEN